MFDPNIHRRRQVRLNGYDYSNGGAYFVTICTHEKRNVFSRVLDGTLQLHPYGRIADECWQQIPEHYPHVALDEWIIMPNHLHGILILTTDSNNIAPASFGKTQIGTVSAIINNFKGAVTRAINTSRVEQNLSAVIVWQSRFYDRIIRNEKELNATRNYIIENPSRWQNKNLP